jgi:hypothetical protein
MKFLSKVWPTRPANEAHPADAPSEPAALPSTEAMLDQLKGQFLHPITYFEPHDVFIASYPKSGVNWLCHLTLAALYGFDASRIPSVIVANLVPDVHWAHFYQRTGKPTIFKTHRLPQPDMKKVVLLYRDGRDCLISYYHMLKNEGHKVDLQAMADGSFPLFPCGWGEFLQAWEENPHGAEILPLRYEDMLTNPEEMLARYCNFCGIDATPEQQKLAIEQSSFHNLQKKEILEQNEKRISWIKSGLFFRQGQSGSFQKEMTPHLIKIFESRYQKELVQHGYALSE